MKAFMQDVRTRQHSLSPELREKLYTHTVKHKMFVVKNLVRILHLDSGHLNEDAVSHFPDLFDGQGSNNHSKRRSKRSEESRHQDSIATTAMINSALFFYHKSVAIAMAHER